VIRRLTRAAVLVTVVVLTVAATIVGPSLWPGGLTGIQAGASGIHRFVQVAGPAGPAYDFKHAPHFANVPPPRTPQEPRPVLSPLRPQAGFAGQPVASCNPSSCIPPLLNPIKNPVQHHPLVYLIFWGPKWISSCDAACGAAENGVISLFKAIAGAPSPSNLEPYWNHTLTEYYDNSGNIGDAVTFGGAFTDSSTPPPISIGDPSVEQTEINDFLNQHSLSNTADSQFILLPQDGSSISASGDCAWHNYTASPANQVFSIIPFLQTYPSQCTVDSVGFTQAMDYAASHEYAESATDPLQNAWRDVNKNEIGDECNQELVPLPDGLAVQRLWDNVTGGGLASLNNCVWSTVPSAPTNVSVAALFGAATVSWNVALTDNGQPIFEDVVTAYNANHKTVARMITSGSATSATLSALGTGTYTFQVQAYDALGAGPVGLSSPISINGVNWPEFGRTPAHGADDPSENVLSKATAPGLAKKWTFTAGNQVFSSPAIANGVVYVGSDDDKVYALNAATGAKVWSFTTGSQVYSSPAVANGLVYVGSVDHKVYALNASTGAKVWSFTTGSYAESSPVIANGIVYVGSDDNKVYALNAATGANVWSFTTGGYVFSSPAVANGILYIGSTDDKVYALNAATGAKMWSFTTGNEVLSSPAVANGVIYVGSVDNKVYALKASTGVKLWSFTTGSAAESSPAVANGIVYVGSYDNKVYALNASTGAKVWSFTTGSPAQSSPAVANGLVFVGSTDDKVYALNAATGAKVWSFTTGNGVISSPAVANGVVYVGSDDNKLYAFGLAS
jgi:outer membrane protein assembly factor BamB